LEEKPHSGTLQQSRTGMEITLERADLLQLDPMSNKDTLKLLPPGKSKKQKLLIGDDSGQLSCFEFKKGEPQVVFQTKVFDGAIACVALGGPRQKRDKIYCAQGQRVVGLTKTGNDCFKLTSSHTESIRNIAVEENRIWAGCEYILNTYDNGHDSSFYMSRDQINGLVVDYIVRESELDTVLACQDNCLRIIHAAQAIIEIPTPSAVTAVTTMWNSELTSRTGSANLLYGLENGAFSAIRIDPNGESRRVDLFDLFFSLSSLFSFLTHFSRTLFTAFFTLQRSLDRSRFVETKPYHLRKSI